MILLLADGVSYQKIQDPAGHHRSHDCALEGTVSATSHRGPDLMEERHPGQKPSVRTPKLQAKLLAAIKEGPKDGSTHGFRCRPDDWERHSFEYRRNGTLSLYATLDVKTGKL
jgi:hypothetical protein